MIRASNPFRKLSLRELIPIALDRIVQIHGTGTYAKFVGPYFQADRANWTLDANDVQSILLFIESLDEGLVILGLYESRKLLAEIAADFKKINIDKPPTLAWCNAQIKELDRRIQHELENIVFGFVPRDRIEYLEEEALFGQLVYDNFPSARFEIQSAGNCFAHRLNTAAVFHLMRTVEVGAIVLAKNIGADQFLVKPEMVRGKKIMKKVPIEYCEWDFLIKGMTAALAKKEHGKRTNPAKRKTWEFYTEVIGRFKYFKDAWRNIISHHHTIGDTERVAYEPGETRDIMDQTQKFMQKLAERLKEE